MEPNDHNDAAASAQTQRIAFSILTIVAGLLIFVICGWVNQAETKVEKMFDTMGTYVTGPALVLMGVVWLWTLTRRR